MSACHFAFILALLSGPCTKVCTDPFLPRSEPRRKLRTVLLELRRNGEPSEFCPISGFRLGRWDFADGLKQPMVIEPVDPCERDQLDGLQVTPRPESMDHFGLVQFGQAIRRADRDILGGFNRSSQHQSEDHDRCSPKISGSVSQPSIFRGRFV
jgi:hypothetical protein